MIWLKIGADKKRVNSKEELRRLFQEVDLIHADKVPTRAGIANLNSKLFSEFIKRVYQQNLPASKAKTAQLLENMNLASDQQLNLAGLLLFDDKPQMYIPRGIQKSGIDKEAAQIFCLERVTFV